MNCEEVFQIISQAPAKIAPELKLEFQEHLQQCESCRKVCENHFALEKASEDFEVAAEELKMLKKAILREVAKDKTVKKQSHEEENIPTNAFRLRFAFVFALVFLGTLFYYKLPENKNSVSNRAIASLSSIYGEVFTRLKPGSPQIPAVYGQKLFAGNEIVTRASSSAQITFANNQVKLKIDPNSYFKLASAGTIGYQKNGRVEYEVQKQNSNLQVQTEHGILAVLGTSFVVAISGSTIDISVSSGLVSFENTEKQKFEIGAGEALTWQTSGEFVKRLLTKKINAPNENISPGFEPPQLKQEPESTYNEDKSSPNTPSKALKNRPENSDDSNKNLPSQPSENSRPEGMGNLENAF